MENLDDLTPLERAQRTHDEAVRQEEASRLRHEEGQRHHEARMAEMARIEALLRATEVQMQAMLARQRQREIWERGEDGFDGY